MREQIIDVEVKNLVKSYRELLAIDHLSLSIERGEIFGLLGPNGSGKTTLINCILALLSYDQGEVNIFGKAMTAKSYDIKQQIGLVPQEKSRENGRIALLLCYVKRSSNLFFRKQETGFISANELTVYVEELAEIAHYVGVKILVNSSLKEVVSVEQARSLYGFAYSVIDWTAQTENPHILLYLLEEEGQIVLRFIASEDLSQFEPDQDLSDAIISSGGSFACKDLDGVVGISLTFPLGGE